MPAVTLFDTTFLGDSAVTTSVDSSPSLDAGDGSGAAIDSRSVGADRVRRSTFFVDAEGEPGGSGSGGGGGTCHMFVGTSPAVADEFFAVSRRGSFIVSRSYCSLASPLAFAFSVSGSASGGSDLYSLEPADDYSLVVAGGTVLSASTIEIPAGVNYVSINVTAIPDGIVDPDEIVNLTLQPNTAYVIEGSGTADISIRDGDGMPRVAVLPPVSVFPFESTFGTQSFSFVRSGGPGTFAASLAVDVAVGGTAIASPSAESDYSFTSAGTAVPSPSSVTFTSGSSTASLSVNVTDDAWVESDETISIDLQVGAIYTIDVPLMTAQITIENDDSCTPLLSISATKPVADEFFSTSRKGQFTVVRSDCKLNLPLSFSVFTGGTAAFGNSLPLAQAGDDFTMAISSFAAGQSTLSLDVTALVDDVSDPDEIVALTLQPAPSYVVDAGSATANVTIRDANGAVRVAVLEPATNAVLEGGFGTRSFTVIRSGTAVDHSSPLVVQANLAGSADFSHDYNVPSQPALPVTVTIPAGSSSTTVQIAAVNDCEHETDETVLLSLVDSNDYAADDASSGTMTIRNDDELPAIAISAGNTNLEETADQFPGVTGPFNTSASVTLTRDGNIGCAVTVRIRRDGTAVPGLDYADISGIQVFAPGETSKTLTVNVSPDGAVEPTETVVLAIAAHESYNASVNSMSVEIEIRDGDRHILVPNWYRVNPVASIPDFDAPIIEYGNWEPNTNTSNSSLYQKRRLKTAQQWESFENLYYPNSTGSFTFNPTYSNGDQVTLGVDFVIISGAYTLSLNGSGFSTGASQQIDVPGRPQLPGESFFVNIIGHRLRKYWEYGTDDGVPVLAVPERFNFNGTVYDWLWLAQNPEIDLYKPAASYRIWSSVPQP